MIEMSIGTSDGTMSISTFGGTMDITTGGFSREYCNKRFVRYDNGSEIYRTTSGSSNAGQGASLEVIDP